MSRSIVALYVPHDPQADRSAVVPAVQHAKGKRGRPRKCDVPRRRSKLRMCIDPNVPLIDKSRRDGEDA